MSSYVLFKRNDCFSLESTGPISKLISSNNSGQSIIESLKIIYTEILVYFLWVFLKFFFFVIHVPNYSRRDIYMQIKCTLSHSAVIIAKHQSERNRLDVVVFKLQTVHSTTRHFNSIYDNARNNALVTRITWLFYIYLPGQVSRFFSV